jgi:hypothetical protein
LYVVLLVIKSAVFPDDSLLLLLVLREEAPIEPPPPLEPPLEPPPPELPELNLVSGNTSGLLENSVFPIFFSVISVLLDACFFSILLIIVLLDTVSSFLGLVF